ncbi:MAG: NAD(P)-dependent oxidoreductase [Thermoproteota archaeon]
MDNNKYNILVVGKFREKFFEKLKEYGSVTRVDDIEDAELEDKDILVVRSKTDVNKDVVDKMKKLKLVVTATHGTDHIDEEYLEERGIQFYNNPVQSYDVAQGAIACIFAHSTNLLEADRCMKRGEWRKKDFVGSRITGKTLGIIGCGNIGRKLAEFGSSMGMKVLGYDPYVEKKANEINFVDLDELLEKSDFVSVNVPLTEKTRCMIGEDEIEEMKGGAFLINTARGGVVDERALLKALDEDKIGGAALDVFEHHRPFQKKASHYSSGVWESRNLDDRMFGEEVSQRLAKHPKVIATPHCIAQTEEALEAKGMGVLDIIKRFIIDAEQ